MRIAVNRDAAVVQKIIANESTKKIVLRNLLTVVLFVVALSLINALFDDGINTSGILFGVPVLFTALLTTDLLMRRHYRRKLADKN